eukprot:877748_1
MSHAVGCNTCGTRALCAWNYCPICGTALKQQNKNSNGAYATPMGNHIVDVDINANIRNNVVNGSQISVKKCTSCEGKGVDGIGSKCNNCKGIGAILIKDEIKCSSCSGKGVRVFSKCTQCNASGYKNIVQNPIIPRNSCLKLNCRFCNGKGVLGFDMKCSVCKGSGDVLALYHKVKCATCDNKGTLTGNGDTCDVCK